MFRDNNQKRVQFIMDSMIETFEKREDVQSDQTLFSKMSKKALDMAIYASENLLKGRAPLECRGPLQGMAPL